MKKLSSILMVVLTVLSTAFAQNGKIITVEISGINEIKGQISIGLFSNEKDFPKDEKVFKGDYIKVEAEKVLYAFKDVPEGTYAIAVYHDANSNKKHDKNFLGIPKEGYGFSNNVFGMFGPPKFKKVSFELKEDKTVKIQLKY
jgi:uncharacterized protein (DUF2141 family)